MSNYKQFLEESSGLKVVGGDIHISTSDEEKEKHEELKSKIDDLINARKSKIVNTTQGLSYRGQMGTASEITMNKTRNSIELVLRLNISDRSEAQLMEFLGKLKKVNLTR